jgi:hypothetical protein
MINAFAAEFLSSPAFGCITAHSLCLIENSAQKFSTKLCTEFPDKFSVKAHEKNKDIVQFGGVLRALFR